ncbi:Nucleotide-binding universal stress protein, UspA family [Halorubrum aquaticum]|uniref:Nucleotide-binding universal stress protein, UspA family n=1 Tax=Halorubrum aquaticum TaxID=387340 RepID=A0A1I2ZGK8_9EURY|nr:universal stress protein [Halorubrum aquaticum]SFH36860.1 Nucleotide-binding universal stress protein, UspA family [Halorubrum aquaticum]
MYGSDADDAGGGETPADRPTEGRSVRTGPSLEAAVEEAAASVASAARATLNGAERAAGPERTSSILVAVAGGPHSGATVDVARHVAEATDAWIELFHVTPSDAAIDENGGEATSPETTGSDAEGGSGSYEATGDRLLDAACDRLGEFDRVDRWLLEGESAAGAITEQSPYYDLVVVGAPTTGTVGRFVFGSTTDTVVDDAAVPVVVVEAAGAEPLE